MKTSYKKYCAEMNYEEFVTMITNKLRTSGSSLQNELFDLLGYENIDFIEYVIEHRKTILAYHMSQKTAKPFSKIFNFEVHRL